MLRVAASSVLAGLVIATSAQPCGFHNYAPQPTLVDRLLGSDHIVLARSATGNPFRFEATKALEGGIENVNIRQLVDSTTRRRFASDANSVVLFAREDTYGPWQRLAYVDAAMAPIVETVMARLSAWEIGEDSDRFAYFATLIAHPDDRIHKLALRELDQADYGVLRNLSPQVDPARLLRRLDDPNESEFRPIRILLLGFGGGYDIRDRLELGVENNVASDGRYLGAYTTALIELVGADAVTDIASSYLTNRDLPLFTRELLIEAISLHSQTGDPDMEEAVAVSIESALWIDSGLAGAVARQFGSRSDWSHYTALQALLLEDTFHAQADKQDVMQYLTLARSSQTEH